MTDIGTSRVQPIEGASSPVARVGGLEAWRVMAEFSLDPLTCINRQARQLSGDAIRIEAPVPWRRSATKSVLMLIGPRYNRQILMATDKLRPSGIWPIPGPPGSAQAVLRRNYLVMHGADHARLSQAVSPSLDRKPVESYFPAVKAIALDEIGRWPMGETADVFALLRQLAQRYAFAVLFGEADTARIKTFGALLAAYHKANWVRRAALFQVDLPFSPYRDVLRQADGLLSFLQGWMGDSAGCPADRDLRGALTAAAGATGCPAQSAEARQAAAHVAGVALASYETTNTTLTWALVLLARHPRIAAALAEEIATIGALEALEDPEALGRLPLLDGVLQETMRLITPVPILGFKTLRAGELAGFDLPATSSVMISPHLTHRLPSIYSEPDRFRPERWFTLRPTTYEYLPFSGGPRRCPGFHFAMTNLRVALAAILTRHRVALPEGVTIDRAYAAITVPRNRVPLRLLPADGKAPPPPRHGGSFFEMFQDEG